MRQDGSSVDERLAIEFISVLGLPPVDFVHLAADLGVHRIGLAPAPFTANPHGYPAWSLSDDPRLRRELAAALNACGVEIALGEGFLVRAGYDIAEAAGNLDLLANLGAERVNLVAVDPDRSRAVAELARFAEFAGDREMEATLEFMPMPPFPDLASGLAAVREVGRSNCRLLVDAMHLIRSGSTPGDLAAADADAIGYLQLCDVPLATSPLGYGEEGKHHRLPPGEGELPLAAILAAAPRDVPVGLEVPQLTLAEQGIGPRERLEPALAAARRLLANPPPLEIAT